MFLKGPIANSSLEMQRFIAGGSRPSVDRGNFGLRKIPTAPMRRLCPTGKGSRRGSVRRGAWSDTYRTRATRVAGHRRGGGPRYRLRTKTHRQSAVSRTGPFKPPGKETLPYEVVESLLRHAGPLGHGDFGFGRSLWGREELWLHAELPADLLPSGDLQALLPDKVHLSASDCLLQACLQPVCTGHLLPSGLSVCHSGSADSLRSAVCSGLPAGLHAARLCGSGLRSGLRSRLCSGLPAGLLCAARLLPQELRPGLCRSGLLPEGSDVLRSDRVLPEAELRSSGLLHPDVRSQVHEEVLRSGCLRSGSLDLRLADGLPRQGTRQGDRSPR